MLLLFYALTIIGYHSWCGPITWELLQTYIGELDVLLAIYGLSVSTAALLVALVWMPIFGGYYYFSVYLLTALASREKNIKQPYSDWRVIALILAGLSVIFYLLTYPSWQTREPFHIARLNVNDTVHLFFRQAPSGMFLKQRSTATNRSLAFIGPIRDIRPRPLILITVDSLRSDQMGVYGSSVDNTPFLSSLWHKGQLHRMDMAYSICTSSACGIVGTLSSKYWHQLNEPPLNLADVLKKYDYRTSFLLGGDHSNFFGLREVYGTNIDLFYDGSFERQKYVNDDFTILKRLSEFKWPSANHNFLYIHLMSVHAIGLHDPRFERWLPVKELVPLKLSRTPRSYRNNYNNGILQTDHIIKQIFRILEARGVLHSALVIITADHGEYLGELNRFGHNYEPYEPMVRVPLLVYDRLRSKYPQRSIYSQVDIAPTMLYAIGAEIPPDWSGIPLQLSTSRHSVYVASYDTAGVVADLAGRRFKYLCNRKNGDEELFDLNGSKSESYNLAAKTDMKQIIAVMRGLNELTNNAHSSGCGK